jgi:methionyl-tRNA formyltransferase
MRPWIALFSQTGNEIYNLTRSMGIYPNCIITNQDNKDKINRNLFDLYKFRETKLNLKNTWYFLPKKPGIINYSEILKQFEDPIITLHGYLRIIPKEICERYKVYNLHPGLINKFPELKGFNPQERAYNGGYKLAGCVIHKVVPEVDEGEILLSQGISIEGLNLNQVYKKLHDTAFDLWKIFFTGYKILEHESA